VTPTWAKEKEREKEKGRIERMIRESFGEAGFAVPEEHLVVRNQG
jgi:hypothetical protein